MAFKKVDTKQSFPKMEEEILKFWDENKIFEKSVENPPAGRAPKGDYVFYDGPPFATGTPHYGHIVASIMKDTVPRYWTMKGYKVERKWGWDCHGLPIENIAEKELGIKRKTEIEEMGVDKFNEFCRSKVLGYVDEWKRVIRRLGRWADMENSYRTMDTDYMESVWWVFKKLWEKGLIYEGYRSMHICTRCETTLSQQEVSEGYKDIKDLSATVKFELEKEPGTFVLAWTTTPWTLIGNVSLAVGKDIDYARVKLGDEIMILAKNSISKILKDQEFEIIEEVKGKDLVGRKYKPLFKYYIGKGLQNEENGWKIYAGDFVTTEDGTGVVHIAPAFGEDDLNLGKEKNLPFVQHVGMDGRIKEEAVEFAGMSVKPQEDHQKTDVEIIKYLAKNNLLFAKEKYEHSYPHCWRCDTPLINYATSSWFVGVTKIKDHALELAKEINWSPGHIKDGRFGKWLEGARDWSISRQRYWASVMPIWKCECGEKKVMGSIDELRKNSSQKITELIFVRHGQSGKNVEHVLSDAVDKWPLTDDGKRGVIEVAKNLPDNIDIIFTSPILRARQSAAILNNKLGKEIIEDELLREIGYGKWNEMNLKERKEKYPAEYEKYEKIKKNPELRYEFKLGETGESRQDVFDRTRKFLDKVLKEHAGKTVLIVAHGIIYSSLKTYFEKLSKKEYFSQNLEDPDHQLISKFYLREDGKSFDLHKDKLDDITIKCDKCSGEMKRIPDVLDTWFDSGSMPYAQEHYPFENKEKFENNFPAEFIAEGVDQTRAWFYYLHVIASAVKDSRAFNNVIVNGIVVGEDGKKLSKRLKNYTDPMDMFEKYGADPLRFYLLSSQVMAAENLAFLEKDVAELVRGMFRMLWNSYSFFVLYANVDKFKPIADNKQKATNLLDKWIISELNVLVKEVNLAMESYELNKACRFFPKFVDNLSNWYIRRSRKRFWKSEDDSDKNEAYVTLHHVLVELSKLLAPFTPFIAEEIFKNLTGKESVHLEEFPIADDKLTDEKLNKNMNDLREIVTLGLQDRAKNKIKVRQPLRAVFIGQKYENVFNEMINKAEWSNILIEELNVKGAELKENIEAVAIDTEIDEGLKLEGIAREIIRFIQEMRKEAGYDVENRINVSCRGHEKVFKNLELKELISRETLANSLNKEKIKNFDLEKEFDVEGEKIRISIRRV